MLEVDDPRTGALLHRCELLEQDRLSVCEQVAQCFCIFQFEFEGKDWLASDLIACMFGHLEARGAITLNDYCDGETVSFVASEFRLGDREARTSPRPVGPGCDALVTTIERALPWPVPADDRCTLTLRDPETSDTRTCPIAAASVDGTCEQIAHCLCAQALEAENYRNNEYYGCLVWAFYGDLALEKRCQVPGASVAEVSGRFDTDGHIWEPWRSDVSTSPGCEAVPLDPRAARPAAPD